LRALAAAATGTAPATAATTAHQDAQLILSLADKLVDLGHLPAFGGASAATRWAPVVIASAISTTTPGAAIVSSHANLPLLFRPWADLVLTCA